MGECLFENALKKHINEEFTDKHIREFVLHMFDWEIGNPSFYEDPRGQIKEYLENDLNSKYTKLPHSLKKFDYAKAGHKTEKEQLQKQLFFLANDIRQQAIKRMIALSRQLKLHKCYDDIVDIILEGSEDIEDPDDIIEYN